MRTTRVQWALLVSVTALYGCSGEPSGGSGSPETPDATTEPALDAGLLEVETSPEPLPDDTLQPGDAQATDTQPETEDTLGVLSNGLVVPCEDGAASLYAVPESALAGTERGDILGCTEDNTVNRAWIDQALDEVSVEAKHGVRELRFAYRTERSSGAPGVSTGFILLPDPPPATPMPIVVWAHGTVGLADACAPSRYPGYYGYAPYAFAAHGYAVVGPDYAGLGTTGVQGYGDARDTAYSVLDAPAALRRVVGAQALSEQVLMVGHSQGGATVLYAQALASEYGLSGELAGVISIAGAVRYGEALSTTAWSYADLIPMNYGMGTSAAFGSLYVYAYAANALGTDQLGLFFTENWGGEAIAWIESLCIFDLIDSFAEVPATRMFDELYEPSFFAGVLDCIEESPSCTEPYLSYVEALKANVVPLDPDGARVLTITGLLDTIVKPEDVACMYDKLQEWGLDPDLCVDASGTHSSVVNDHIPYALAWTEATLSGESPPECDTQGSLPSCL